MRFLVKATLPVKAGNALVRDPSVGQRIQGIMRDIRPEAVYFAAADGQRTVYAVVNLQETHESQLGVVSQPRRAQISLRSPIARLGDTGRRSYGR